MLFLLCSLFIISLASNIKSDYRLICEDRLDKPDSCDEYCKLVEQVQACKSNNDHHKSNDCSGEEEQELHKQREVKKSQCMEILFPKKEDSPAEVNNEPEVDPIIQPDEPQVNNVDPAYTESTQLQSLAQSTIPNDTHAQLLQQLQQQSEMILLLQTQLKEMQQKQRQEPAEAPTIKTQPLKQSSSKSSTTSYFLIIIIFGIFILHLLFYVFAMSRVINNNTEQMKKMVSILAILEKK